MQNVLEWKVFPMIISRKLRLQIEISNIFSNKSSLKRYCKHFFFELFDKGNF